MIMASKNTDLAPNSIEQSPSWEKSREAIRRPIKKRKNRRCLTDELDVPPTAVRSLTFLPTMDWDDSAARSPFDCSHNQTDHCFSVDTSATTTLPPVSAIDTTLSILYPVDFSHFNRIGKTPLPGESTNEYKLKLSQKNSSIRPPWDWRLGTRLRLISEQPFPWLLERQLTATGNYAVRLPEIVFKHQLDDQQTVRQEVPLMDSFHRALLFHQFPSIGAVHLFPRRSLTTRNALLKSANLQSIESNFMYTLGMQWSQSLLSLLNTISSAGSLPSSSSNNFFYLCAPQFTSLFVAVPSTEQRRDSPCHLVVLVTPTTSGFRQILQTKGIEFTLPFKTTGFVELSREDCPKDFLSTVGDESIGMDNDEWLRDLGISPRSTLKLKQSPSELDLSLISHLSNGSKNDSDLTKSNEENSRSLSETSLESSQSVVLIRGTKNAEAFCHLLISQPTLVSTKTGPQAGLPPTLISPVPFRHNTLKELSVTSQVLKKQGNFKYVLEVDNGPVMPSSVERLLKFVRSNCAKPNRVQIHVVGRAQCSGINEALNAAMHAEGKLSGTNFAEMEWVLSEEDSLSDGEQLFRWN